jgi:hypothetical protein
LGSDHHQSDPYCTKEAIQIIITVIPITLNKP